MSNQGKVEFTLTDTGEKEEFYIIEQTVSIILTIY